MIGSTESEVEVAEGEGEGEVEGVVDIWVEVPNKYSRQDPSQPTKRVRKLVDGGDRVRVLHREDEVLGVMVPLEKGSRPLQTLREALDAERLGQP